MTILITAATGNVGRTLVTTLTAAGVRVRAFVRDPGKARALLPRDTEIAVGDFGDEASLEAAASGVAQVFLGAPNHPDQVRWEQTVIDAARRAGVERVVKLSAHGAEEDSPVAFWDAHARIERHLAGSRLDAVVLRPTTYATNLLASLQDVIGQGMLVAPAAGARVSFIDPADVAAVAAAVLTQPVWTGRTLTLTGESALTFEQVAGVFANALGRDVSFVPVDDDQALAALIAAGLPEWFAGNVVRVFAALRHGHADLTTDTVARVTGHAPRPLAHTLGSLLAASAEDAGGVGQPQGEVGRPVEHV